MLVHEFLEKMRSPQTIHEVADVISLIISNIDIKTTVVVDGDDIVLETPVDNYVIENALKNPTESYDKALDLVNSAYDQLEGYRMQEIGSYYDDESWKYGE